jgi:hypothetical protein
MDGAFVGKFGHKCRPLLWMDAPTPVSDSVNICSYVRRKKILKNMHFLIYYIDICT